MQVAVLESRERVLFRNIPTPSTGKDDLLLEFGREVTDFREGERVVPAPKIPCGTCYYCLEGSSVFCENRRIISVADLITELPLDSIDEVFRKADKNEGMKVMILPDSGG